MKFEIGEHIIRKKNWRFQKDNEIQGTIMSKVGGSLYSIKWLDENVTNWYRIPGIEENYISDAKRMSEKKLSSIL
jgi:hypothetical protein